jgi:hypothetical protein
VWQRRAFIDLLVRAPLFLSVTPAGLAGCRPAVRGAFTEAQRACLQRVCYLLFPYPELGDEPYARTAAAIAEQVAGRAELVTLVAEGVAQLDGGAFGRFLELDEARQVRTLKDVETGPFFRWLYAIAIDHLYNDERVWSHIGYEGSSFEKGGYLQRGFDDIDWL